MYRKNVLFFVALLVAGCSTQVIVPETSKPSDPQTYSLDEVAERQAEAQEQEQEQNEAAERQAEAQEQNEKLSLERIQGANGETTFRGEDGSYTVFNSERQLQCGVIWQNGQPHRKVKYARTSDGLAWSMTCWAYDSGHGAWFLVQSHILRDSDYQELSRELWELSEEHAAE